MFFNNEYISTKKSAELCQCTERTIRNRVYAGEFKAMEKINDRGNTVYYVQVSSLPAEAQIRYLEEQREECGESQQAQTAEADLVSYRERYGQEGMEKLLRKLEVVQKAIELEVQAKGEVTKRRQELAKENGIGFRTLCDWLKSYQAKGLAGLIRKSREEVGSSSFCLKAIRIMMNLYLDKNFQRLKTVSYKMMVKEAKKLGETACVNCEFCPGSPERVKHLEYEPDLKECKEPNKSGLKYSSCEKTAIRILSNIPEEIVTMARRGFKAWEAGFMKKAKRAKPDYANTVWFGDHHQLNCFVSYLDQDGNIKVGRPWLTAWYDIATACLVGWCISMQPNSITIAEAFIHAAVKKKNAPFSGIPLAAYTDNGKDYRSEMFEGGKIVLKELGKALDYNIETKGLLAELGIQAIHAKPYHGWAKPIERWFRTLSDLHVRDVPGWCGANKDERPEGFDKHLKKLIQKDELWTIEEFATWFETVVLPDYHNTPHSGDGYENKSPLQMYSEKAKARYEEPSWSVLGIIKMQAVERTVTTQGIEFNKKIFDHPDLDHQSKARVRIKFNSKDDEVIIVTSLEGKFICAATQKDELKMVFEEEEKIGAHMARQKRQERETKERIAKLTGRKLPARKQPGSNKLTGEVDKTANGNITSLEHEKAMKEYEKAASGRKSRKADSREDGEVKKRFERMGEKVLQRSSNIG